MLKIDEKTLEDILQEGLKTKEGTEKLAKRGLHFQYRPHNIILRQFNLKDYGITDLIKIDFINGIVFIDIIELKVVSFDVSHLIQLGRYMSCVNHIIKNNGLELRVYVRGTLIVSSFDSRNEYTWLDSIIGGYITVYSTEYSLDGMYFKKQMPNGWHMSGTITDISAYLDKRLLRGLYKDSLIRKNEIDT